MQEYIINNDEMMNIYYFVQNNDEDGLYYEIRDIVRNHFDNPDLTDDMLNSLRNTVNIPFEQLTDQWELYFNTMNEELQNIINNQVILPVAVDQGEEEPEPEPEPAPAQPVEYIDPMSLPTRDPLDQETLMNELATECTICYRPMGLNNITITRCSHTFHASCLYRSLDYSDNCPICRTQLIIPTLE